MVKVGQKNVEYTVPTGFEDKERASVMGGYFMATTLTTYKLWYEVRIWAEANGYFFQNLGRQEFEGRPGDPPIEDSLIPVSSVSWRDTIVWLNALSEMKGFDPVYRDEDDNIIRDARESNAGVVDAAIQTNNDGFRLPTSDEWDMAARWKNDTELQMVLSLWVEDIGHHLTMQVLQQAQFGITTTINLSMKMQQALWHGIEMVPVVSNR